MRSADPLDGQLLRRLDLARESRSTAFMNHLRYSNLPAPDQEAALISILLSDPLIRQALEIARGLNLPDWLIVSGALYNCVWNHLTGKPSGYGTKDIDLFYHDASDLSYEAEDRIIRHAAREFAVLSCPVEIRNQARVHLWYPGHFGNPCPQYRSSAHSLEYFASETHAVGARIDADGQIAIVAPFGLNHIFSFHMTPNYRMNNRETHEAKAARAMSLWPELSVSHWE